MIDAGGTDFGSPRWQRAHGQSADRGAGIAARGAAAVTARPA